MRILCDLERLGNLYKSAVSLLFNYFMSLHALSLHLGYKHCVFKDLILRNSTWLIWYTEISFSIIVFSKQLFVLIVQQYFVLTMFSHFNNFLTS